MGVRTPHKPEHAPVDVTEFVPQCGRLSRDDIRFPIEIAIPTEDGYEYWV